MSGGLTDRAGNLALSRALGDFEFKQNFALTPEKQIVTADPEFVSHDLDGEEEFIVVACDGESAIIRIIARIEADC